MRGNSRKKKNPVVLSKLGIICISMIILMNIIGVGYGSWQSGVEIHTTINTGCIDPVFVECEIEEEKGQKDKEKDREEEASIEGELLNEEAESLEEEYEDMADEASYVDISDDKKQLNVFIKNAYPGYSAKIRYRIENQGTIPITCKVDYEAADNMEVDIEEPEGVIYGFGGFREGVISIELEKDVKKEPDKDKEESASEGRGEEKEGKGDIDEELEEETEKAESYEFVIDLLFEQYNISH